jgi:hypothetical protein
LEKKSENFKIPENNIISVKPAKVVGYNIHSEIDIYRHSKYKDGSGPNDSKPLHLYSFKGCGSLVCTYYGPFWNGGTTSRRSWV